MEATYFGSSDLQASNDAWYPSEISEFMLLKDNMDNHTYEMEADLKDQLLGQQVASQDGVLVKLTHITAFEIDKEEYTPAINSDCALNARMFVNVDGECMKDGIKSEISKLPVCFDFEYISHSIGYTISSMSINA
ncbi:MAG: hypothetical protein ACI9FB_003894 [Candidatus Azotimanducaceae bacterium]|jgi:hypothetical protein